jgi:hypothetical protein
LTGIGRLVVLAGSLLPVAALVSGFWLHGVAERDRALRSSLDLYGNSATAVVTGLSRTGGKSPQYNVAYRYPAGGEDHQGRRAIRQSEWRRLQVGSPLPVRYLPASPARSWIAGYEPRGNFWVGPVAALGLAILAVIAWQKLRREWMLLAEGRAASATVTRTRMVYTQHGWHYKISYEFRTLSDTLVSGRCRARRSPPPVGTTIQIVYDPDNPQRSGRYPFSLVRPVFSSQPRNMAAKS